MLKPRVALAIAGPDPVAGAPQYVTDATGNRDRLKAVAVIFNRDLICSAQLRRLLEHSRCDIDALTPSTGVKPLSEVDLVTPAVETSRPSDKKCSFTVHARIRELASRPRQIRLYHHMILLTRASCSPYPAPDERYVG